jgi:hypothetical protein
VATPSLSSLLGPHFSPTTPSVSPPPRPAHLSPLANTVLLARRAWTEQLHPRPRDAQGRAVGTPPPGSPAPPQPPRPPPSPPLRIACTTPSADTFPTSACSSSTADHTRLTPTTARPLPARPRALAATRPPRPPSTPSTTPRIRSRPPIRLPQAARTPPAQSPPPWISKSPWSLPPSRPPPRQKSSFPATARNVVTTHRASSNSTRHRMLGARKTASLPTTNASRLPTCNCRAATRPRPRHSKDAPPTSEHGYADAKPTPLPGHPTLSPTPRKAPSDKFRVPHVPAVQPPPDGPVLAEPHPRAHNEPGPRTPTE